MSDNGDNVWILGTYMTKFGRHGDKDLIDLASEAALGAMNDGGVTIHDMEVLGCGSLFNAHGRRRPAAAEADRPDRHPRLQRRQRVRHGRDRVAHGAAHHQGRRGRHGSRGRRGADGQGRVARCGRQGRPWPQGLRAERSLRLGDAGRGHPRHRPHARRVRAGGHGVRVRARRRRLRAVRQGRGEEPRALHAEPARALPEAVLARRDHGGRHDELPEHVAHVLPEHRRLGRGGVGQRREAAHAVEGAAGARGEDQRVGAHDRPVDRARAGAARRQHAHAQRGEAGVRDGRVSVRRISTSSSCTTASRRPSSSTTTTCSCARRARPASSSTSAVPGATGRPPSTSAAG